MPYPALPPDWSQRAMLYLDLLRWDRPAGWLLLLWPTLSALWLAAGGFPGWHLLAVFVLGTILMRSAGCCVNDVADREFDRHVQRTARRPVTTGHVSVREALAVGAVLALIAFALVCTTNLHTVLWACAALAVTLLYPYSKRYVSMPQAVLGVAFGMGIFLAYAAVGQELDASAWILAIGNLCWVLAYDTAYAMVDRDDDLRIGIRTSAITLGRWDVATVMGCYALYLASWALLFALQVRSAWGWVAVIAAGAQVAWHYRLLRARRREECFRSFRANHWLGCTLFVGLMLAMGNGGFTRGALIVEDLRQDYKERRFQALGFIGEHLCMLVFTPREGAVPVIGACKGSGAGWQTRINNALREWLKAHPEMQKG
ncbi:4-hydroxybenzoate polyprenyltransferase [Candidatus Symbiobacter mobilis CR]|uniref:4-hydroxybenzoate octaprenyltransferase n=1 Tax=Candidatus Symbiobacter mobilis CR TaxID=946483 RepID=U5N6Q9_9BURK|nr:4-hydroxybenzoate polyprenyltransferase [Candidatus Symbiobacter mobilis CR]